MTQPLYNLMMLSGDSAVAQGKDGAFYQLLARFSRYWGRIDILTPSAPHAQERVIHGNVYIHPAPRHRALQPFFIKQRGEQLLRERTYHLIVSHDFGFYYNGIGAYWLTRGKQIPLISEIHHLEGYPIATNLREKLWRQAGMWYLPFIAKHVQAFRLVNRQEVYRLLKDFAVPDEKILVLSSLYLDLQAYQPQPITKTLDILFVGRLATNKGIMLILDAVEQVKQHYPEITLGIRGEGALKPAIDSHIIEHGLQDNVHFLPRIASSAEMPTLYNQSKMLVCASTVEGNPRVTIEAMACGVPVLSTRVGVMPDVIEQGENGFLFDNADELRQLILSLLNDPSLQTKIAHNARQSVLEFDAEKTVEAYAKAYHRVIEKRTDLLTV